MDKNSLIQAYRQTIYRVYADVGDCDCKIGEKLPAKLNSLLGRYKMAIIITACNPASQLCADEENQKQNQQLQSELDSVGYHYYPAIGIAKEGDWQEASFFVVGISRQQADALAERYGQNAYIWLEQGKPVELVFTPRFQ